MPKGSASKSNIVDMTGQKFNRLTVVSKSDQPHTKGDSSSMWNCLCECGTELVASRRTLLAGRSKSCGCLRIEMNREQAKRNRSPGIVVPLRKMIRKYQWNANKRGQSFTLTEKQFLEIILKNCHYCGEAPAQISKSIIGDDKEHILIYNGIDRVDNTIGYESENCVAACGTCNRMKSDLTKKEFFDHLLKIVEKFR